MHSIGHMENKGDGILVSRDLVEGRARVGQGLELATPGQVRAFGLARMEIGEALGVGSGD
jgi:hypothetical protein